MTIGLALAGLAIVAAAAHPRGAKSLMGLTGTPEEHLAKFRDYLAMAQNQSLPSRFRFALVERAWAESEWASVPPNEISLLTNLQSELESGFIAAAPRAPVRSNLVISKPARTRACRNADECDTRNPPAGWKHLHDHKGTTWLFTSLGNGQYEVSSGSVRHTGSGNVLIKLVHNGIPDNFYRATNLGVPGTVFNPMSPPKRWFL